MNTDKKNELLLKNARLLHSDFIFRKADMLIRDGVIVDICPQIERDCHTLDLRGKMLLPGLVDTHIHGAAGMDVTEGKQAIAHIAKTLPQYGVTSFLPTTMTLPMSDLDAIFTIDPAEFSQGARVLGYHMEGPYINKKYKGAQNEDYIIPPNIEEFGKYPHIRLVTVAPEVEGGMDFIRSVHTNAVVSIGHSAADLAIATEAIATGATCVTHMYNAHAPCHHRDPGIIGAAFASGIYVQQIMDNIHIHPLTLLQTIRTFTPEKVVMISDAMCAAALSDGKYSLGGQEVFVNQGKATLASGTIAGSVCLLWNGVKNAAANGTPLEDAIRMASLTPATMLGMENTIGALAKSRRADFLICDDVLNIEACYVNGINQI